jgi:hypothetical protein
VALDVRIITRDGRLGCRRTRTYLRPAKADGQNQKTSSGGRSLDQADSNSVISLGRTDSLENGE